VPAKSFVLDGSFRANADRTGSAVLHRSEIASMGLDRTGKVIFRPCLDFTGGLHR
jgi:hypothetical protein